MSGGVLLVHPAFNPRVARNLGGDTSSADNLEVEVGLGLDGEGDVGEEGGEVGFVGGGLAERIDVDLGELDAHGEDLADEQDGRVLGLLVEVRWWPFEHTGGDAFRAG